MATPATADIANWKGAGRRYAKFWRDKPVRNRVIALHAQSVSVRDAARLLRDEFGSIRAPSKSAVHRTWRQLDELVGKPSAATFFDIDVAKERQRRDRASVVDRQVEGRTQRVHIVLEIKSGGHATRLDRSLGLIGRAVDRLRGMAGRRDIGGADVAQHEVCERIELRLDSGQSVVIHVSPFPAVDPFADSPTREGGK